MCTQNPFSWVNMNNTACSRFVCRLVQCSQQQASLHPTHLYNKLSIDGIRCSIAVGFRNMKGSFVFGVSKKCGGVDDDLFIQRTLISLQRETSCLYLFIFRSQPETLKDIYGSNYWAPSLKVHYERFLRFLIIFIVLRFLRFLIIVLRA